jgi:hypothetical protein
MNTILSNIETTFEDRSSSGIAATVLLGRLLRKLHSPVWLEELNCSDTFRNSTFFFVSSNLHFLILSPAFRTRSQLLYDRAITRWRDAAVQQALSELRPAVPTGKRNDSQSGPSASLMNALRLLSNSLQQWAYFDNESGRTTLAKKLLETFIESICLRDKKVEYQASLWDLCFLHAVCMEWGNALAASVKRLAELIKQVCLPRCLCFHQ